MIVQIVDNPNLKTGAAEISDVMVIMAVISLNKGNITDH